ncbi:MAG TPA: GNAT family N-acetyltransferase, partial [Acidimicrobiales bacterium]|nr:GNAT family N-acetyltransferase [Acidimicrobiales bacterium]
MTDQRTPRRERAAGPAETVEIVPFEEGHLPGILQLCVELRWPSLPTDAGRALRALTAPGVTTVVAVAGAAAGDAAGDGAGAGGQPVGFAEILSDGAIQAYLALLAVHAGWRRQGIGRRLVL